MSKEFINFAETGKLRIEKVLFAGNEPIFFTSRNEKNDLYLCVCNGVHDNMKKWLIVEVSAQTVVDILQDKIHLREPFLNENKKRFSISLDKSGTYSIKTVAESPDEWDSKNSLFLPAEGEYMEVEGDEFDEEIEYYIKRGIDSKIEKLYSSGTFTPKISYQSTSLFSSVNLESIRPTGEILFSKLIKTIDDIILESKRDIEMVYVSNKKMKEISYIASSKKTANAA